MSRIIELRLSPGWIDPNSKDYIKAFDAITDSAGRGVAEYVKDRLSHTISKGGPANVGASGAASENLYVFKSSGGQSPGFTSWSIGEGGGTLANVMMRKGLNPGVFVPRGALMGWAVDKRIPFVHPKDYITSKDSNEDIRRKAEARKVHYIKDQAKHPERTPRAWRKLIKGPTDSKAMTDEDRLSAAVSRLQWALYWGGTQRPSAHWWKLFPVGSGNFEYVVWTVRQAHYFQRELRNTSEKAAGLMIHYLSSGVRGVQKAGWHYRTFYPK